MGAMLESRPERVDSDSETALMQVSDTVHLKYSWRQRHRSCALREAQARMGVGLGVGPTYLHKRGHSYLFLVMGDRL